VLRHWTQRSSLVVFSILISSCGNTDTLEIDHSEIWSGVGNQVKSGGYWFTYADHLAWMEAHPDANPAKHTAAQGAQIAPLTDMNTPLKLTTDPDSTSGHGETIHVVGQTPAAPAWTEVATSGLWFDTYYQQPQLYPDSLTVAYPVAGVGFGFLPHNAAGFDPSQGGKYVGFAFDMKTLRNTVDVDAQIAVVCSSTNGDDLHDDTFEDAFGKPGCTYPQATSTGETLEQQATDYSSGPNSYLAQTCYLYEHKTVTPKIDGQWSTYCVLWNEMTLPDWAKPQAQPPVWSDETLKRCTTKLKWEMHKPQTGEASLFEIYLDNVKLINRAQAASMGCTLSALPTDTTKVIGKSSATDAGT